MKRRISILVIVVMLLSLTLSGCVKEEKQVELYQLAPEKTSLMESYVIKTANNHLIVIDGGIYGEGYDAAPYMPAALRAILGLKEGEYFEVDAWFLSHNHSDHFYELAKMLRDYTADSNYKINNFLFDFPAHGTEEYPVHNADLKEWAVLKAGLNNYAAVNGIEVKGASYYDDVNGAVINAASVEKGLSFDVDGVKIDVLQTWDKNDGEDVNNNSLILKVWVDGQSILFLNDAGLTAENRLLMGKYKDQVKSDIVQLAHHGQNGLSKTGYDAIDADVYLWTTPLWVWLNKEGNYQIDTVREWLNGETYLKSDEWNIVSCLYSAYPTDPTSVEDWKAVKDGMKIVLPYSYSARN